MITPQAGTLLIAEPFLKDPNFVRSVVLLCEHNKDGCVGFVLNQLHSKKLNELNIDFAGFSIPLYVGGPVEQTTVHFIHQYPEIFIDSVKLCEGIYWGGNFETLTIHIKNNSIDLNKIKIFLGYSGWDVEQLDEELAEQSWIVAQANAAVVFDNTTTNIWKNSVKLLGSKYEMMINYPTDPQLN
jgi:putative transcriptional regulator